MAPKDMKSRCFPFNQNTLSPHSILSTSFGMVLMVLVIHLFHFSNPDLLLIIGVMTFSLLYGIPSGIVSFIIMYLYSLYFFSVGHSMIHFRSTELQKMIGLFVATLLMLFFSDYLRSSVLRVFHSLEEENKRLEKDNKRLKIDNERLSQLSRSDPLTSLQNRLAMEEALISCKGKDCHILLIDVDNFKNINDQYGHDMGDQILSLLGRTLKNTFGLEHCYRYGGDEFLVIYPSIEEKQFFQKSKELIHSFKLGLHSKNLPYVAISGGYVFGEALEDYDINLMIKMADHLLYNSKQQGKNTVQGEKFSRIFAQKLQNSYCSLKGIHDMEMPHLLARTS